MSNISYSIKGEGDDAYLMIIIKKNDMTVNVSFLDVFYCGRSVWDDFLFAMKNSNDYYINFYQGNGHGCIELKDGRIIFSAMPSGAGGDVDITVSIKCDEDAIKCFEALIINDIDKLYA